MRSHHLFIVFFFTLTFLGCANETPDIELAGNSKDHQDDAMLYGLNINNAMTIEQLLLLAKYGDTEAAFRIAEKYFLAEGVKQKKKQAAQWYLKAAEKGHKEAVCKVAIQFDGALGARDYAKYGKIKQSDPYDRYKWLWLCRNYSKIDEYSENYTERHMNGLTYEALNKEQVKSAELEAQKLQGKLSSKSTDIDHDQRKYYPLRADQFKVNSSDFGICLLNSVDSTDVDIICKWFMVALAQHHAMKDLITIDLDKINQVNKEFAQLSERLLTVNCITQAKKIIDSTNNSLFDAGFDDLISGVSELLFAHPSVEMASVEYEKYIDNEALFRALWQNEFAKAIEIMEKYEIMVNDPMLMEEFLRRTRDEGK